MVNACVKAGKVLPSRQMIRGYADSEGVAPGYSDAAFQAKGQRYLSLMTL